MIRGRIRASLLVITSLLCTTASAKPKVQGWYCYLASNDSGQAVEACERTQIACDAEVAKQSLPKPAKCFVVKEAAAFIAVHDDGRKETLAMPQMEACEGVRSSVQSEPGIARVSACRMIR